MVRADLFDMIDVINVFGYILNISKGDMHQDSTVENIDALFS